MVSEDEAIEEVEKFIRRLNDGEFIISTKTTELFYATRDESPYEQYKHRRTLSDTLADVINTYVLNEDNLKKSQLAKNCRAWIEKAWTAGVIQEGQGLVKKLDECREEKNQMEKELSMLSQKYLTLQGEFALFKKTVGLKSKADWRKREK
jgi:hypothetical protein